MRVVRVVCVLERGSSERGKCEDDVCEREGGVVRVCAVCVQTDNFPVYPTFTFMLCFHIITISCSDPPFLHCTCAVAPSS